jgi:hypothetical protein
MNKFLVKVEFSQTDSSNYLVSAETSKDAYTIIYNLVGGTGEIWKRNITVLGRVDCDLT